MEIRRFGPGHRRPEGPPGTHGVTGQVIHDDARGQISELSFGPRAFITPHSNPNTTLFVVISGGGFVQVGSERVRVAHGEAVVWPAHVPHGAYTEGTEMRAIVVELAGADDGWARGILEGVGGRPEEGEWMERALPAGPGGPPRTVTPAVGRLEERPPRREEYDESSGEPW